MSNKEKKYVGVHLEADVFDKLEAVCQLEDRSKNYVIAKILETALNEDVKNVSRSWTQGAI